MLSCQEVTRLVSQAQERKLSLREKVPLKLHLMMCSGCRNFSQQVPFLSQAMRAFARWEAEQSSGKK